MTITTFFITQGFKLERNRWKPIEPQQVQSRGSAERFVERHRAKNMPALAFARTGDPESGEWDDAEVIAAFNVPAEFGGQSDD